jgi:2-hydroxycyclohexanecarboxyl-CoA dehydrogenase
MGLEESVGGPLLQKVAIVTGAARPWGLGYQIALDLAKKGLDVAIADLREDWGQESAAKIAAQTGQQVLFVKTDVSRRGDVQQMVVRVAKQLGRIDVLVNNAAIEVRQKIADFSEELFDRMMAVNLKGAIFCCQAVIPEMRKAGGGRIVNVGSGGAFMPLPGLTIYAATKAGLTIMSKVLAWEVVRDKIVVTVVAAGRMLTAMGAETGPDEQEAKQRALGQPWGRALSPSEVSDVVVYAATNPSHVLTGQTLHANGGGMMLF